MHASAILTSIEMVVLPSEGVTVMSGGGCAHADWCMYHAYSGIKYYLHRSLQYNKGSMNAIAPVDKASFQGQLAEDAWRAIEWTTVLRAAAIKSTSTFALDEVSRGIRHASTTSTVPIWATFGIQTLLGIQDVWGTTTDKACKDFQAHVQYASKMLVNDLESAHPFPAMGNTKNHTGQAITILNEIKDRALKDLFGSMLRQQPAVHTRPVLGGISREPGYLMKHHPLRSGMLKYDTCLQLHSTGTGAKSQMKMAFSLAHLYAACRFSYPNDPVWPDMEFMLER